MSHKQLRASKEFAVRFSEVDAMNIVWHGSYPLYFEDAREAFGAQYGLEYMTMARAGYYAPLVELTFRYLRPIRYEQQCRIDIIYTATAAAKSSSTTRFMMPSPTNSLPQDTVYKPLWTKTTNCNGTNPPSMPSGKNDGT